MTRHDFHADPVAAPDGAHAPSCSARSRSPFSRPPADADTAFLAPLWLVAIAWTVLASLAGALLRGFRHGDWSAFRRHGFPEDDGEADEFASRTGRYQWLGDQEDRLLHDDDHLR